GGSRLQREDWVGPTESYLTADALGAEWNGSHARAARHNGGKGEPDAQIIDQHGRADAAGLAETPGRDGYRALGIIGCNGGVGFCGRVEPQLRGGGIDVIAGDHGVKGVGVQIGSEHGQRVCAGAIAGKKAEGIWGGVRGAGIDPATVCTADKMREIIGSILWQGQGFEFEAGIESGTVAADVRTAHQLAADVFSLSCADLELAVSG